MYQVLCMDCLTPFSLYSNGLSTVLESRVMVGHSKAPTMSLPKVPLNKLLGDLTTEQTLGGFC